MFEALSRFFRRGKIQVFVRHCHYSQASAHKGRIYGFSRERCLDNLLSTLDPSRVDVTFFLDTFHPMEGEHFIKKQDVYPVIELKAGCEALSFLQMLDYVCAQSFFPETPLYFLEDDYLHLPGWVDVLLEGLALPGVDYVTLYDHKDKYFFETYRDLRSKIYHTQSCHWRTTPSTTNTYAMRFETLQKHLPIHRAFSEGRKISSDHEKFCALAAQGATLISSIPGFSTHMDPECASPCTDWAAVLKKCATVHPPSSGR